MLKRTEKDLYETAIHEAGHCIAAIAERKALNLDPKSHLKSAHIVLPGQERPSLLDNGYIAIEGGGIVRSKISPVNCICPKHIDEYVAGHGKDRILNICRWSIIVNLAGPAATALCKHFNQPKDAWCDGGQNDVSQAMDYLKAVFHIHNKPRCPADDAIKILERIHKKTEAYLQEQWASVQDVAEGLMKATRLNGYTVEMVAAQRWKDNVIHGSMK